MAPPEYLAALRNHSPGSGCAMGPMLSGFWTKMFFFGQFLRSPARIGSVCPSSKYLSHALVSAALENDMAPGLIVDLGAGSGVVSQELLKCGVAPERILALDISGNFVGIFSRHCPGLRLHIGDARNLAAIISTYFPAQAVQAVISSLPLRSMPDSIVAQIMLEIRKVLYKNGGALVQYTYAVWQRSALEQFGFFVMDRRYAPINFPPALVEKYYPLACA